MSSANPTPKIRVGLHIYVYFGIAIIICNLLAVSILLANLNVEMDLLEVTATAVGAAAIFNLAMWFASRRCSSEHLTGWNGLLLITAHMAIGVGAFSLFLAVPVAILSIFATFIISAIGLVRGRSDVAPRLFHKLVEMSYRYRMYQ